MDEPRRHRQEPWGVDVSGAGGNIGIGGAPQTGKSTLLQTLMLSAAATHTPRQVQFYCIDLGGGGLMYLDDLPHVGGVATRSEPDRVMRVVAEVQAVLRQREAAFKEHRVGSIAAYRQLREDPSQPVAADPFGDVFLVIDGWPAFVGEFPDLEAHVQDVAAQGLSFGVHTIITTPRWTELKSRVRDYLGTKIEFRLGDVNDTQIDRAHPGHPGQPAGPGDVGGEAPPDDRRSQIRWRAQRREPGRGDHRGGEARRGPAHRAKRLEVRVLPERIHLYELDPNPPGPESDYRTRWTVPVGLREIGPLGGLRQHVHDTAPADFWCGQVGQDNHRPCSCPAICARNSPDQVRFMLADYRSGLLDAVPDSHLLAAGAINRNAQSLDEVHQSAGRQPAKAAATGRPDHHAVAVTVVVDGFDSCFWSTIGT